MSERQAKPVVAPLVTRPGESLEHTGSREVTKLLPSILQTQVNSQFLDSTLEQLMSSGSLQAVNNIVGKQTINKETDDNYLIDGRSNDPYQFTPGFVNRDDSKNVVGTLAYDDLIKSMKYNDIEVNNLDKSMNEMSYTLDLPINYDMFLNYHKYFWLADVIPHCEIKPTSAIVIDIDDITVATEYTTPVLSNGKTLKLQNGMRIQFAPTTVDKITQTVAANKIFTATSTNAQSIKVFVDNVELQGASDVTYVPGTGVVTLATAPAVNAIVEIHTYYVNSSSSSYNVDDIYIVDNVGQPGGIKFTTQFQSSRYGSDSTFGTRRWINATIYSDQKTAGYANDLLAYNNSQPFDERKHRLTTRDYFVEQRNATDQSAWSRSNLWIHEAAAEATFTFNATSSSLYLLDKYRAVRPIIEFKANIQKFAAGTKQIAYVDHGLESSEDPATTIVGQATYDVMIAGITTEWAKTVGADKLTRVKLTTGTIITYWECVQSHSTALDPLDIKNREFWQPIVPVALANKDLIIFFESANAAYKNKIFEVGGVGTSITLAEKYNSDGSNSATALVANDKIVLLNGFNTLQFRNILYSSGGEKDAPFSGSELFWNGTGWVYGQQKHHRSQGILYELYDTTLTKLSDPTKYPLSDRNYSGGNIFNFTHSETNTFDNALGFKPEYSDYGNNPGLNFQIDLLHKRFTYTEQSADLQKNLTKEIPGYYYYKNLDTNRYQNGWSNLRGEQSVKRVINKTVTDSTVPLMFDLGNNGYWLTPTSHYRLFKENGVLAALEHSARDPRHKRISGKLPNLYMLKSPSIPVNFEFLFPSAEIEFVDMDGSTIDSGVQITNINPTKNDSLVLEVQEDIAINSFKYRLKATPNDFGVVYLSDASAARLAAWYNNSLMMHKNGAPFFGWTANDSSDNFLKVTSGLKVGDHYRLSFANKGTYSDTVEGSFEVADTHKFNPQNLSFNTVSYGDLIGHISSQMTSNPRFTGDVLGVNNYRNMPHDHTHGGTIRQQPYSTELVNQLFTENDTDPISSLQHSSNSYRNFMQAFKTKIAQLHTTLDETESVYTLVDKTLEAINVGKNKNSLYSRSQMAMYRDYESLDTVWVSGQTPTFKLPQPLNEYDNTFNHHQLFVKVMSGGNHVWKQLKYETDYTLNNDTFSIEAAVFANSFGPDGRNNVHFRWYPRDSSSFVPPSAVKLGLTLPSLPAFRTDYIVDDVTKETKPTIHGHDGSIHIRNGTELYDRQKAGFDPVDAGLWDLELRIYNNLGLELSSVVNHKKYLTNAARTTSYSWKQHQDTMKSEYNKWKTLNNKTNFNSSSSYDASNGFTWNYSSVTPNIGGWRGLYHYFFNTDRPHTDPWEMMGYNKKPTWWDANYDWGIAAKRTALITALKSGNISDPSLASNLQVYDLDYSYGSFDWTNKEIVTTGYVLKTPVDSGIIATAPSATNAAKDFAYGDSGPVETEWRRSSEFRFAEAIAMMRTRPLIATNLYFKTNKRVLVNTPGYENPQVQDTDTGKLSSWKNIDLSDSKITGAIIESVRIKNPGSGYSSTPTVAVYDNFGSGAKVRVSIINGSVSSVRITKQGQEYYNTPRLELSSGNAVLEAVIAKDTRRYFSGMSNSITSYALLSGTTTDVILQRFKNMTFNPIVKAGGFVNSNQKFILESSQDKGRVFVPEENFSTHMYVNKPDTEYFFGGIIVTKSGAGYKINGYDNSLGCFKYTAVATNSTSAAVQFEGIASSITVRRYIDFETVVSRLDYNTVLDTVQEVYDFINGYGNYLNSLGFTQQWKTSASNFGTWAASTSTEILYLIPDPSKVTVQDDTLGYFDNLNTKYDGVYNIVNNLGTQIGASELAINRSSMSLEQETVFEAKDSATTKLYGLRLYKVQMEHIIIFDNVTNFDDVIASSEIGQVHERIIWRGSRTKDWNGKLYTPGHIVNGDSILPNFDSVAGQVDQYYGRTNTLSNKQMSDVARFNSGYNKPDWAKTLDMDDDSVYEFTKGTYKYKGTRYALDAFMRNKGLFNGDATADLHEMWAVRMADFGDTDKRRLTEFQITPELLVTNPQPVRFTKGYKYDVSSDIVIDIDDTSHLNVYNPEIDQFTTREVKTYVSQTTPTLFVNDFINAGLPLINETDYRAVNKEDFLAFPQETKPAYDFDGDWQDYDKWDSKTSYKLGDKVVHLGKVWEMSDPDGASGLTTALNPIVLTGSVTLPIIPSAGQTLIVDGTTISLTKSATSTVSNIITVDGTQDVRTSNVVAHNSTLEVGQTSTFSSTVTFINSVVTTTFNSIVKTGTTVNPLIQGSATATLLIEGTTVNFNETVSGSSNITAQVAYENTFNSSWTQNQSTIASTAVARVGKIEALRSAYVAANTPAAWTTWITTYYTNNAGINIDHVKTLIGAGGSTLVPAQDFLAQDVILVNNILGTSFNSTSVEDGSETITASQISNTQGALNNGDYTDDIATYLKNSTYASSTFSTTTVVATESSSSNKQYALTDIVTRINAAGIANVTASATASSQLRITKITNTPATAFSLVISAGTMNATVGFNGAQETIQSQSTQVITTPALTQQQVVDQINNANITGVTANILGNLIRLQCSLTQFYIGAGTANSTLGISSGVTPASTITATTASSLNLTDILESINLASITGVTAINANNKIKITSTNATLIIGAGTANDTVGFIAKTTDATLGNVSNVFNAVVGSDGNQVFQALTNDPNLFSIWVADDSEFGNYNLGYEIYQTMDFGMYTHDACGGILDADEAQLDVTRQTGDTQAHNLVAGDYILIRGSDTIPSIDGVHKVTRVDPNNTRRFYIDQYIEATGHVGNIYPLRKMRFSSYTEMEADRQTKVNGVYKYNFSSVRQNNSSRPVHAFVDNDGTGLSQVYKWIGTWDDTNGNNGAWHVVRTGNVQARNDLVKNVKLYDAVKQTSLTTLETWDPAKGIVFGFIQNEIDFTLTNDVANYNNNTLDGEVDNINAWQSDYIGQRWWDLSTAVYLDYEQGNVDYMQNNWGKLFDGASIDIYEWTRSPVLPEQWSTLVDQETEVDGQLASGSAYFTTVNGVPVYNWSQELYYNKRTKRNETVYYFWVKSRTNFSGVRNYNVLQLSQLLVDPSSFGIQWCATASSDIIMLAGIANVVTNNTVVQLDVNKRDNALPMQDWLLLAEGDEQSIIPEYLHIKVRDSLSGFNRFSITETFTTWASNTSYAKDAVVKDGANYYISRVDSNLSNQPSTDSNMSHWNRIYDYAFEDGTQADDIIINRSQPVPDLKLHKFNRYGHQVRPRQSLYRDLVEARQNFVYTVNSLLSEVNVIDEINNWETAFTNVFVEGAVTYDVYDYVSLVDWKLTERDLDNNITYQFDSSTVPDKVYATKQAYIDAGEPIEGSYILIKNTSGDDIIRSEMYYYINGADKLVFKKKATVELSEEMWFQQKFGHGFDTANFDITPFDSGSENVISKLFDLLRTKIFINHHKVKYNKLWFKMLFTALLQNTADDFAFKTTYTSLGVKRPLLLNKKVYQPTSIEPVESFINTIKPFHTKLLNSIESNTHGESTNIEIDELSRTNEVTMKYEDHSGRTWAGDTILSGGGFTSTLTNVDSSLFTTPAASLGYDYNGNVFQQTALEGWGEELVPTDYTENIQISVQTNTSGAVYDGQNRAFRMTIYQPNDIQISNVIIDAEKTTLSSSITATDTTIPVTNRNAFSNQPNSNAQELGVAYINGERITYHSVDEDSSALIYCTRGTLGTSARAHDSGDTIQNSGPSTRIPTLEKFSHYGDNLRMAYNDSGTSLSAAGISPEHAFIRNVGAGSI